MRDQDRLRRALEQIDSRAGGAEASLAAEHNPMEFVKTNVLGMKT